MYLDENSQDKVKNANGDLVTQQQLVLGWANAAQLPSNKFSFDSRLPDDLDLEELSDTWYKRAAQNILQNQQTQMMNLSVALNQSFYNKVVVQGGALMAGVGTLKSFLPNISNMAAGKISASHMSIGGNILKGIGEVSGGVDGAATSALEAVEGVMTAAIGGLSAIAAINPIVGAVAAAGFMIGKAVAAEGERQRVARVEKDNAFYGSLLPLPKFDKSGDEYAMNIVLQTMPKSDWTNLFIPRYDPNERWVGRLCQTGVEFFPGDNEGMGWGEGDPVENGYNGSVGLGMIPGTQQVTDTLQGQLSSTEIHEAERYMPKDEVDSLWEWAQMQAPTRVGNSAIDTGDYYPSSAQTMSFLWGHIQTQGVSGNPDLYKIDCPFVDGQWRRYCDGAWDYLQEMCSWDAYNFDMKGHSMKKHIDKGWQSQARRKMMVAQHSCVIACLLGVYRCVPQELGGGFLTTSPPYKEGKSSRACKTGFNDLPSDCRQSIYDAYIHDRVRALHQMQFDMLSASLVCAYVRSDFAAFNGNGNDGGQAASMMTKLKAMRNKLLNRPDQWKYLIEANVPRDEMHGGKNWYQQLKDIGAFEKASMGITLAPGQYGQGGLQLSAGHGFDTPAPKLMQLVGRVPGQELVIASIVGLGGSKTRKKKSSAMPLVLGAGAMALLLMKGRK